MKENNKQGNTLDKVFTYSHSGRTLETHSTGSTGAFPQQHKSKGHTAPEDVASSPKIMAICEFTTCGSLFQARRNLKKQVLSLLFTSWVISLKSMVNVVGDSFPQVSHFLHFFQSAEALTSFVSDYLCKDIFIVNNKGATDSIFPL